MENLIPDIDINELKFKNFFNLILTEIRESILNEDNDDKIESLLNLIHNIILIEKQILRMTNEIRQYVNKINDYIKEAKDLENNFLA